jgi:CHASE3 domain sensor protein
MNTKTILLVIAVLLAAIAGILLYQQVTEPKTAGEQFEEALNEVADDIGDAVDDMADSIEDAAEDSDGKY